MLLKDRFFTYSILGTLFWCGNLNAKSTSKRCEQPNIIFIFSDQQSFDMLGCYGNKQVKTPNIDKLSSEGVKFNHCISSCPVSTPYRGMLLSGMHPLTNGAIHNDFQMLPGNGNYFGEVLRDNGYYTGYFGKWHLYGGDRYRPIPEGPLRYGFDNEFLSNNCTMFYDSKRSYFWNEKGVKEMYNDWEFFAQSAQAIDFIDRKASNDKPIALFLSWHAPHHWEPDDKFQHQYSAPEEFEKLYAPQGIVLRKNCKETPKIRSYYQGHMAMISAIDSEFGKIINKIEEKGISENTIIIFTSDHGDMLESHNWKLNKGCPEIESIKVPLIIKYAKKLKPRESNLLVGTLDLMPTILGLANLPVPASSQGIDLSVPIKKHKDKYVKSVPLFFFVGSNWRGVYTHDYTYSFAINEKKDPHGKDFNVLYNHKEDPSEFNNLFKDERYNKIKIKLHNLSLGWMKIFNDKGLKYEELINKILPEEMMKLYIKPFQERVETRNYDVIVKGRPVDLQ